MSVNGLIHNKNEQNNNKLQRKVSNLDIQLIFNITANLSNIIFDKYDEENGEIAKGRAFGTKGEHRAAEILYENMTLLGLNTTLEQLEKLNFASWVNYVTPLPKVIPTQ